VAEHVYSDADDRVVLVIDMLIAIISPFLRRTDAAAWVIARRGYGSAGASAFPPLTMVQRRPRGTPSRRSAHRRRASCRSI
jgi:hypothetical protein